MGSIKIISFIKCDLTIKIWKDKEGTDYYLAYCIELDITSAGDSKGEALLMIRDSIERVMASHYESETFFKVINECFPKSKKKKNKSRFPKDAMTRKLKFSVGLEKKFR